MPPSPAPALRCRHLPRPRVQGTVSNITSCSIQRPWPYWLKLVCKIQLRECAIPKFQMDEIEGDEGQESVFGDEGTTEQRPKRRRMLRSAHIGPLTLFIICASVDGWWSAQFRSAEHGPHVGDRVVGLVL
eukprot:4333348-Pyramimonas_sp.AAC.1